MAQCSASDHSGEDIFVQVDGSHVHRRNVQADEAPSLKRRRHIRNERQRRVHMNTLLDSLQSLLPDSRPRKDRCTLLTDVLTYIDELDNNVEYLTTRREELRTISMHPKVGHFNKTDKLLVSSLRDVRVQRIEPQQISTTNTATSEAIISFVSSHASRLLSRVLFLLHESQIEVINATFSTTQDGQMLHYIHAQVPSDCQLQDDNLRVLLSSVIKKESVS